MKDMNDFLQKNMNLQTGFSGIVVGESMGGNPYRGDKETVAMFRAKAACVGLQDITISAAAGGPEIGLDQLYKQVYDWTPYDRKQTRISG